MLHFLLIEKGGDITLNGQMLIVRYPEGDVDVLNTKLKNLDEKMRRCLYDEYQVSDVLKDGDEFAFRGRVKFACEGIHVVSRERLLVSAD